MNIEFMRILISVQVDKVYMPIASKWQNDELVFHFKGNCGQLMKKRYSLNDISRISPTGKEKWRDCTGLALLIFNNTNKF